TLATRLRPADLGFSGFHFEVINRVWLQASELDPVIGCSPLGLRGLLQACGIRAVHELGARRLVSGPGNGCRLIVRKLDDRTVYDPHPLALSRCRGLLRSSLLGPQ